MDLSVIFLLGFLHLTVGQKDCENLKLFDGDREVELTAYNCTQFSTDFCKNGFGSFPRNLSNGLSVSKPRDFSAPMYREMYGNTQYLVAGIKFNWKMPIGGVSRKFMKGFFLNMQAAGTGNVTCFLFDLQNTNFTTSTNFHFEYKAFPVRGGSYAVELFSLPPPSDEEYSSGLYERHVITVPDLRDVNQKLGPGEWTTWIQLHLHQEEGKVEVMFGYPDKFDNATFTKYKLQLEVAGESNPLTVHYFLQRGSDYGIYNFTEVPSGNYTVRVKPEDEYNTDNNQCQCWTYVKGIPNLTSCSPCTSTYTPSFIFNSSFVGEATAPSTNPSTSTGPSLSPTGLSSMHPSTDIGKPGYVKDVTTDDGLDDGEIAAVIIGSLVVIIALLVGVFYIWRRRKQDKVKEEKGKVDDNRNIVPHLGPEKAMKVPNISKKKVLLLASEDHRYFHQALQSFAQFLELHCQCIVLFAPNHLKTASSYSWLSGQIDTADFVIIVNSEAAFRLYQAHQNNCIYKEAELGPEGDLFTPGIRHICGKISKNDNVSNVVMVHFGHTARELCLPIQALPHEPYRLPDFLKTFLFHIHNLNENKMDLSKVNLPLQGNIEELEGGKEWLMAVQDSKAFESNDRNWFKKKFGESSAQLNKPYLSYQVSKESGYFEAERDSGSFQRRLSSVSTHAQDPSDTDHLVDQGITNLGFTKHDFIAPSVAGDQSVYTIPFSSYTVAESQPEIDQDSVISDKFRTFNEQYDLDRAYEQQEGGIPQTVATGYSDLSRCPNVLLQHPDAVDMYQNVVQFSQYDSEQDCVSLSSAQSV